MGRSGLRLIDYILQRHEKGVKVIKLEPLKEHGFYGWLARSFVPGLKATVKTVDISGYKLVYLLAPKWGYNCPPINGFIDSHEFRGLSLALIVTYTKGDVSAYVARPAKKLREKGANLLGTLALKREEILSDRFKEKMHSLWDDAAFGVPLE